MQQLAAARTVKQATRILKQMNLQAPELEPVHELGRTALRQLLEERMQARVQGYLERSVRQGVEDRRNGAYRRWLLTAMGAVQLCVPRTRRFSAQLVVEAYGRREREVDRLILAAFVLGLSTRKVGEALLAILGERVSATTVSRVAQQLDAAVSAFHHRPLANRYRALLLDGVVLANRSGRGVVRRPVLVAMGITNDGRKEILDFVLARGESQAAWEAFLNDLFRRGLTGEGVTIAVCDGGAGLLAALPLVYPKVRVQRCWAHKVRNVLDKVKLADRETVKRSLNRISNADDRTEARRHARAFVDRWQRRYPAAVRCLWMDIDDLLAFFVFDDPTWRKATRTTNAIERRFREVRRRTRPMGVMADPASIERILFAIFSHENYKQGTGTGNFLDAAHAARNPSLANHVTDRSSILGQL
jgi:transposase-like protein